MKDKSTNLQIMRFMAAVLVIFSHAFVITQGTKEQEWLYRLTKGQIDFGGLAVSIFFLCGGYLAAKGMEHYTGFKKYIVLRLARIIPALMFVVIVCIIMGAFVSTLSVGAYFSHPQTWRYLLNGIMILQHDLPGVFEDAVYLPTVNGALWTLPIEFLCNIACCICFEFGILDRKKFPWTVAVVILGTAGIYVIGGSIPLLRACIRPCLLFYVGIIYWIYRDKIIFKKSIAWICILLLPVCSVLGILNVGMILLFPYAMITCWFYGNQYFKRSSQLGSYSYAMYLWGFPIQQFIAWKFDWRISFYLNAGLAVIAAFVMAVITYKMVERPAANAFRKLR